MTRANLLLTGMAFWLGTFVPLGWAQNKGDDAYENVLEELIVTATRRESDLQTTSVAATVLTGEGMEKKGVTDLIHIQYAAPGVTIGDYGSANTFNIRGIGRSQVDIDIPPGIQLYRDKVPMFPGYFQNEPYYDMAGMEVLRGPQGTLAGKSAAGGAIYIRTEDAVLGENSAYVEGGIGNLDAWETTAMLNMSLSDTFAFRLAATHRERDDWYDSIGGSHTGDPGIRDLDAARLTLNWAPNENFEGKFKLDWNELDFGGNPTTNYGENPRTPKYDGDFTYIDTAKRAILDLGYDFDNGMTLTSVSGYQYSETINNRSNNSGVGPYDDPNDILSYDIGFLSQGDFTLLSQEFNLLSPTDQRLRWVAGAFYQDVRSYIPPYPSNGFNLTLLELGAIYPFVWSAWKNLEEDLSAFANGQYDINDELELEVGVRFSHYERRQQMQFHVSDDFGFTLPPTTPAEPFSDEKISENSVDYKVGLNWSVLPEHFLYGFVARGHTTGGINIAGPPHTSYDEVEVIDFEAGWKGTLLGGRVQTQLGAYYQTLEGFQGVFATDANTLGSRTQNAEDDSKIYGVEFNLQAVVDNWGFDFGGAWTKTELGAFSDIIIPPSLLQWFPGSVPGDTIDLSGAQSPYSPELTFNVGVEYNFHFGETIVTPRADFSYIDEQKDGLYDIPPLLMEERELLNLAIRFEHGPWYGQIYCSNCTDQTYIGGIQELGQLNYMAPPRLYAIKVGRHFNW